MPSVHVDPCDLSTTPSSPLNDSNTNTCFLINNTVQLFMFTKQPQQPSKNYQITVNTNSVDCRENFHVLVYVSRSAGSQCSSSSGSKHWHNKVCHVQADATESSCRFICECDSGKCLEDGRYYIRIATVSEGYLCEVTIQTV